MIVKTKCQKIHQVFLARAKKEKKCPRCGKKNVIDAFHQKQSKEYMCSCLYTVAPLSNTPIHRLRIPLPVFFSILKDVLNSKDGIGTKWIEDKYGISNTSAWNILYRIKGWINLTEENEGFKTRTKFTKLENYIKGLHETYHLKYSHEFPADEMKQRMLDSLPPLFEHLNTIKLEIIKINN